MRIQKIGLSNIWLAFSTLVILVLSVLGHDSVIGTISAVTGVCYTILTGKGKASAYIFGIINVLGYSYVSFKAGFYGEVMLNVLYFLPMCIIGWVLWRKNTDNLTGEVTKKRMRLTSSILVYTCTTIAIFVYGLILKHLGGSLPFIDSMSTVISVVAQILCVKRYTEQWILWTVVNAVTVIMWGISFSQGGENISTLIMWSVYLITGIAMFIKWYRDSKLL